MAMHRTAVSEWFWAGGPNRRLLVSLLATLVVIVIPAAAGSESAKSLVVFFIGWDVGSWFMDRIYVSRLSQRELAAR